MMTNLRCLIVAILLALGLTGLAQAQTLYYIHADQLNTPRLIADEAGTTVWRWDNREPFGTNAPSEYAGANGQPVRFNLRFPGQYYDSETGTFYNYFRDYDPQTGRYIQSDPIGLAGGINTYTYVDGKPISLTDLHGTNPIGTEWNGSEWVYPPGSPLAPSTPTQFCATAECAAGLLPAPMDLRPQSEVDKGQCKLVCQIVTTPPVAACNAAAGGGLPGMVGGAVAKAGFCSLVCN